MAEDHKPTVDPAASPLRVLLLEDDEAWARALVRRLRSQPSDAWPPPGYPAVTVDHFLSESAAEKAAKLHRYDLVILDLNHPKIPGGPSEICGFDWLPRLQQLQPRAAVVICSAFARSHPDEAISAARRNLVDDILSKPVAWDEMMSRLRLACRNAASRAAGGPHAEQPVEGACFISYSTEDKEFAERLYADLRENGIRCWFAPHEMRGGQKLHDQIVDAIRLHDRVLVILSEHSMRSRWVRTEIAEARQKEADERRQVLFPIGLVPFESIRAWKCFDADIGSDAAREIREYYIPDFSNWRDDASYRNTLRQLVADLKQARRMP
jgi:DNA-binding response OmpR family regulator